MQTASLIRLLGASCLMAVLAGCQGWTPALPGNGAGWFPDFGTPTVPEQTEPPIPSETDSGGLEGFGELSGSKGP